MIMKIAIAKDGFIDTKEIPNFTGKTTFLECIQELLNFEEKDLMEFDGNTCQLINSYNPTNSIFIYTNQQGTFLYTITDATQRVHKNNFIWDCNCYKMEDIARINEIVSNGKYLPIIYKNIFKQNGSYEYQNVEVKDNFRTQQTEAITLRNYCLKLKFSEAQHIDNTLVTYEDDGSYNFFFPIQFFGSALPPTTTDPKALLKNYYSFWYSGVEYTLNDIIEHYSTNLKSVELLPFFPYEDDVLGGSVEFTSEGTFPLKTLKVTNVTGGAKVTKAGIFFPYGHSVKRSTTTKITTQTPLLRQLVNGGGVRGFLSTPLGNYQVTYNGFQNGQVGTDAINQDYSYLYLDSEGWHIDGVLRCDVSPHYINYFTNETSQLLIQNMTTNAQELRQMQREYEFKQSEISQSQVYKASGGAIDRALSGDIFGAIKNTAFGLLSGTGLNYEYEFEKAKASREFNLSMANYNDKIKTQSLLASMTGKQINGNIAVSSITPNLNICYFVLFLEFNYTCCEVNISDYSGHKKRTFIPQQDYDYSTNVRNDQMDFTNEVNYFTSMAQIFGYYFFGDNIGLNYSIVFKFSNVPSPIRATDTTIDQTQVITFNLRNKPQTFEI